MGMGTAVRAAAAATVLAVAAVPASADPYTRFLDDLVDEIDERMAALEAGGVSEEEARAYAALGKAAGYLDSDSVDEATDLALLRKAALALQKAYPDEFTLESLYNAALAQFRLVIWGDQMVVLDALFRYDNPILLQIHSRKFVAIDDYLSKAEDEPRPPVQMAILRKGLKSIRAFRTKVFAVLRKQEPDTTVGWMTGDVDGLLLLLAKASAEIEIDGATGEVNSVLITGFEPDEAVLGGNSVALTLHVGAGNLPDGVPAQVDFDNVLDPVDVQAQLTTADASTQTEWEYRSVGAISIDQFRISKIKPAVFESGIVRGVVSGTFSFTANTAPDGSGEQATVTYGRFQIWDPFIVVN